MKGRLNSVVLVSCASKKRTSPSEARDLYTSALFSKARAYAEAQGESWFILSAKYGLLDPRCIIDPYDQTLNGMKKDERKRWSSSVVEALQKQLAPKSAVTILAGKSYREYVAPELDRLGYKVNVPLAGLGIGRQLRALSNMETP